MIEWAQGNSKCKVQSDIWPEDQMLVKCCQYSTSIFQKSENEQMEQPTISLKSPYCYRTDEKIIARDEWYKIVVEGLVKLNKLISW